MRFALCLLLVMLGMTQARADDATHAEQGSTLGSTHRTAADDASDGTLGSTVRTDTDDGSDGTLGSTVRTKPVGTGLSSTARNVKPASNADPVDPALCRALVNTTPSADLAYRGGVDSQGRAVASADLPGAPQIQMPQKIAIPLTVGLAQALHQDPQAYPYNQFGAGTEANLGTLTVEDNNVRFNGQPLSDTQQQNLAVLCLKPNP